ncbi:MAG TPA: hypothetical protein VL966_16195 [Alphaproteobacteria bacterium]|nr:hypothetical protein [Alphaproteobacteria bacterium]
MNTAQQIVGFARASHATLGEIAALLSYLELGHARAGSARIASDLAPIAAVIHAAAVERLIDAVVRLTDPRADAPASLAPVFVALADGGTFDEVASGGNGERLGAAVKRWSALPEHASLTVMRAAWNAEREHLLPKYDEVPPAVYGGFVTAANEVLRVIVDLIAGCGIADVEIGPILTTRRAQADAYWTALTRGKSGSSRK